MATNSDDTDPRQPDADDLDPDSDLDGLRASGAAPPRFGRLALCVAAAGALTFGVIGTVAYGVWFNHDQQTYAEAITSARRALGSSEPGGTRGFAQSAAQAGPPRAAAQPAHSEDTAVATTVTPIAPATSTAALSTRPAATLKADEEGGGHAIWSGQIQQSAPDANSPTALADTSPDLYATPAAAQSSAATQRAANAADSPAPQSVPSRTAKDARLAQQDRRAAPANAKHRSNLFARVGQFFRRVSYRQHGSGRQQQQDIYSHP
ncbi:hypothetical protein [Paraburkholderia sp.]|uniref:hypothetical protein n=1 Tax=Paraburkholderia sp. TaxID=1926495 RepID=UPI0039E45DA7